MLMMLIKISVFKKGQKEASRFHHKSILSWQAARQRKRRRLRPTMGTQNRRTNPR